MLYLAHFALQEEPEENLIIVFTRAWYNGSYTMAAEPIKSLELHYTMIQFLIKEIMSCVLFIKTVNGLNPGVIQVRKLWSFGWVLSWERLRLLGLSKCQSMSPQTVLLRTTLTQKIRIYVLMYYWLFFAWTENISQLKRQLQNVEETLEATRQSGKNEEHKSNLLLAGKVWAAVYLLFCKFYPDYWDYYAISKPDLLLLILANFLNLLGVYLT